MVVVQYFKDMITSFLNPNNRAFYTNYGMGYSYFALYKLDKRVDKLPFIVRILIENSLRNCDGKEVTDSVRENLLEYHQSVKKGKAIPFKPSRAILNAQQAISSLREIFSINALLEKLGLKGLLQNLSTLLQVFKGGKMDEKGEVFLKSAGQKFKNLSVVNAEREGALNFTNLEFLARVIMVNADKLHYPDSVIGTDPDLLTVGALGVLGLISDRENVTRATLDLPVSFVLPEIVRVELSGSMPSDASATDLAIFITGILKGQRLEGKFVEFHGPAVGGLSVEERAVICSMAKAYKPLSVLFPIDEKTLEFLRRTGRTADHLYSIEAHTRCNKEFRNGDGSDLVFSREIPIDISNTAANALVDRDFERAEEFDEVFVSDTFDNKEMVRAGLIARNAAKLGLKMKKKAFVSIKNLSMEKALKDSGLFEAFERIGFVSGEPVSEAAVNVVGTAEGKGDLLAGPVCAVLKGFDGENFEKSLPTYAEVDAVLKNHFGKSLYENVYGDVLEKSHPVNDFKHVTEEDLLLVERSELFNEVKKKLSVKSDL